MSNSRKKQVILYEELLAKVQGLLVLYPKECRNIHLDSLELYREQVDGANWRVAGYRRSGDDNDWTECHRKIAAELRTLRQAYDVGDKT
jgi:hypothetical protein